MSSSKRTSTKGRPLSAAELSAHDEFLRSLVADPQKMRRELQRLRRAKAGELRSSDSEVRIVAEWWCSEQRIRDSIDDASFFDDRHGNRYGGGVPVFHPFNGPREIQVVVSETIREFRDEAGRVFSGRLELDDVHADAHRDARLPLEEWCGNWSEKHWVAYFYKAGMFELEAALGGVSRKNWAHALVMMSGAQRSLRAINRASLRPTLMLAQRASQREAQIGKFQKKGAASSRRYSDSDRERWRQIAAEPQIARLTKRSKARHIQRVCALPAAAAETIRKVI